MGALLGLIPTLLPILGKVFDKIFPDPEQRDRAKLELMKLQQEGAFKEDEMRFDAIVMEAKSKDPWTSRARPSFLYVVYLYILAAIPFGVLFAYNPDIAGQVTQGVQSWLAAIPEPMWWLFGSGYLGYSAARSMDKRMIIQGKK